MYPKQEKLWKPRMHRKRRKKRTYGVVYTKNRYIKITQSTVLELSAAEKSRS